MNPRYSNILPVVITICLQIVLVFSGSAESDPSCPTSVGQWPYGANETVAVSETHIFYGQGMVFTISRRDDTSSPIAELVLDGVVTDIEITHSHAFVTIHKAGLAVVDIADPADPSLVASLPLHGQAQRIRLSGTTAYIVEGVEGVTLVDISEPTQPVILSRIILPGTANDISFSDSLLLIVTSYPGELWFYSVSDPSMPRVVSPYQETRMSMYAVAAVNNLAYVSVQGYPLLVIDFSDPATAFQVGSLSGLYQVSHITIRDNLLFLQNDLGFSVASLEDPISPTLLGTWENAEFAADLTLHEDRLFLADKRMGVRTLDISRPNDPVEIDTIPTTGHTWEVVSQGDYAYVANSTGGLRVVDISDENNPFEVAVDRNPGDARTIAINESALYVGDRNQGILTYDLTDPAHPLLVDWACPISEPNRLITRGTRLYALANGLSVLEISNPLQPTEVGFLSIPGSRDLDIFGSKAYIISSLRMRILDITDSGHPAEMGLWIAYSASLHGVAYWDGHVYVADTISQTLRVIDVSDPTNPTAVNGVQETRRPYQIVIEDGMATIALAFAGVSILDLSNPIEPLEVGLIETPGTPVGVSLTEHSILVADYWAGFSILDDCTVIFHDGFGSGDLDAWSSGSP